MKIHIAHSPDSDDAFMFYGLAGGHVPTGDLELVHVLSDIETLNRAAFDGTYEISAVSFHAYAHLTDKYILLPHGASMGDNYGPIVVAREDGSGQSAGARQDESRRSAGAPEDESRRSAAGAKAEGPLSLDGVTVAIPGLLTTAFLALRLYKPDVQYVVMPFDEILEAVRDGKADAGLLIHEGQLTYAQEGLRKVVDLGEWWAARTDGLPLPLGGNVIRRDLGPALISRLSRLLHDSIAYGLSHRAEAVAHAMQYGRGLDRKDTDTFVGMYVNELTLDYGERGRTAVLRLLGEAAEKGLIPPVDVVFAE